MRFATTIRYNAAKRGGFGVRAQTFEAESVGDALEKALAAVEKDVVRRFGSICVVGVTIDEVTE